MKNNCGDWQGYWLLDLLGTELYKTNDSLSSTKLEQKIPEKSQTWNEIHSALRISPQVSWTRTDSLIHSKQRWLFLVVIQRSPLCLQCGINEKRIQKHQWWKWGWKHASGRWTVLGPYRRRWSSPPESVTPQKAAWRRKEEAMNSAVLLLCYLAAHQAQGPLLPACFDFLILLTDCCMYNEPV